MYPVGYSPIDLQDVETMGWVKQQEESHDLGVDAPQPDGGK